MTKFIYYSLFWIGYFYFRITKKTLSYSYYSFRKLFVLTKGNINDTLSKSINQQKGKFNFPVNSGVLGNLTVDEIAKIVSNINQNGYYIFPNKLSEDYVSKLKEYSMQLEAELIPIALDGRKMMKYDSTKPLSPRYQFRESDLLKNSIIQELTTDYSMLSVAQEYLGAKPIQDLTAMWWSTAFSKEASSAAAQLYHFDMDRFKFIKFFFYLTDVDSHNGPHCYVRGSHRQMPENLWRDGRIQDNEIFKSFSKDDIVEISGLKGSIIAVDTRGLHKGKVLERGERLILQFEFTNSLFGAPYEVVDFRGKIKEEYLSVFKEYSHTFQRFKL